MSDDKPLSGDTAMVADSPLDETTLDGLRELADGDPSFLIEVIQQFLHDGPGHMTAIQQAVSDGNADALMKAAHGFKGSCRNMGALSLGELCYALEQKGHASDMEHVENLLPALKCEEQRVQVALEHELSLLTGTS